jgi:hypothetical protein
MPATNGNDESPTPNTTTHTLLSSTTHTLLSSLLQLTMPLIKSFCGCYFGRCCNKAAMELE